MRITFISPAPDLSGGQRVIANFADRLRRRGHDVLIVAPPHRRPTTREILRSLACGQSWPVARQPTPSHYEDLGVAYRILDRPRPVRNEDVPDADVVIATWWETAEWVSALASRKGIKVHFQMDYEIWGGRQERVDATCRLPMFKIIIAEWVGRLLRERFGVEETTLVPLAADPDLFHAPPRGKQPRATVGLTYTAFRNKGCDISLRAVELACRDVPDLQLVTFGQRLVAHSSLPPAIIDLGRLPNHELRHAYARCDAWLYGTRIEGFGLPILEAMACRTPVIGTPAGAAPELLAGGGGILVRPEDPEDMASAIVQVCTLSDPDWRAMSDRAHATAARYTWNNATDRFEQALILAVEKSESGRSQMIEA